MFGQPDRIVRFDFATLIPAMADQCVGDESYGYFDSDGANFTGQNYFEELSPAARSFHATFCWPVKETDLATCVLAFVLEIPRIIFLIGRPNGFGGYGWKGICPQTMKPSQILQLDSAINMFVSCEAVGRPAPKNVNRPDDYKKVLDKAINTYGKFDILKFADYPDVSGNSDFAPLESLFDLFVLDAIIAKSGYPFAARDSRKGIDVLATMNDARNRQRLPRTLLAPNRNSPAPKRYSSIEELREAMRARGMPVPDDDKLLVKTVSTKGDVKDTRWLL